ncbi:AbrB family transcriptional regulator [Hoeflea marina]|uniref:AbrB family transcriptional regulator n=1 Tax=Hoeflea marina TaxID=274592 RepID=A0A317PHT1_9HYPH|nr:AbrB/MazE/SpoVT family DNA-binding domain-containing protein [Hoeflea marina]PWV99142.1 AbrB family transcriptional regulator [Hoeflea marina]
MGERTRMSSRGQVLLPKQLCDAHGWTAGTEFEVVDGATGVQLRPVAASTSTGGTLAFKEFVDMIPKRSGSPVSDELIDAAITEEARRRWHEKTGR